MGSVLVKTTLTVEIVCNVNLVFTISEMKTLMVVKVEIIFFWHIPRFYSKRYRTADGGQP